MFRAVDSRRRKVWGRQDVDPWVLVMAMQLLSQISQLPRKPPVTLALIAINVTAWMQPGLLFMVVGDSMPMMCPLEHVSGHRPWSHLLLAAFVHAADGGYHLFYNMSSLLWKGVTLELEMGSERFAILVWALLLLSHGLFVPVSYLATNAFGASTYYSCAVGFSAVLFGLKVVMNHSQMGARAVQYWGIPFPVSAKYAAWLELVLISMVAPSASFVGHLCGILAGIVWLHFAGSNSQLFQQRRGRRVETARSAHGRPASGSRQQQHQHWGSGAVGSESATQAAQPGFRPTQEDEDDAQLLEAIRRSRYDF